MTYVWSLGMGLMVGAIYACTGIRSPAPPLVALVGLLGIVAGEQGATSFRHWIGSSIDSVATGSTDRKTD